MNREKILKAYLKGWDDELNGDKLILPVNELERKACILGSIDALVGDELSSVDNKTDDDIIARTIKSVKNENLSELINVVYNSEDQIDGEYIKRKEIFDENGKELSVIEVMNMFPIIDFLKVNRVEVIDENGRSYVNWKAKI